MESKLSRRIILNLSAIVKPCQLKVYQQGKLYCLYDANAIAHFSPKMLDGDYWQQHDAIVGSAQGRGTTWFIAHKSQQWVLRHYYRGGLVGRLIKDSYLFLGLEKTRAIQEFTLLQLMQRLALPAPAPIACRIMRSGIFYRADLLSQRIENAHDLVALLTQQPLSADIWRNIGVTIAKFHQQGIYHHDLNAHNILLDNQEKVWLIDFDRGEQRALNASWLQQNMARLLRSFRKEKTKLNPFYWQDADWQYLLQGYRTILSFNVV